MNFGDLFERVKAYLDARAALETSPGVSTHPELAGVSVVFGPREIARTLNQGAGRARRIVFVYGDDTGKAGAYLGAQSKTASPGADGARVIQTLGEEGEIHIWGFDAREPTNQLLQYRAVKALEAWLHRALRASRMGFYELGEATWIVEPKERALGAAMVIGVTISAPIYDQETDATPPGVAGVDAKTFLGATQDCGEEP